VDKLKLISPAKINLNLLVDGRFDNGFHAIRSFVCPIDLADSVEVSVEEAKDLDIELAISYSKEFKKHYLTQDMDSLLSGPDNLVLRAANAFIEKVCPGKNFKILINLHKNIPLQAGLGGGSSNAASTLLALRSILKPKLPDSLLIEIASLLGSDIVAFISRTLIFIHGTGNKSLELSPEVYSCFQALLQEMHLIILKPFSGVSTPSAYESFGFLKGSFDLEAGKGLSHQALSRNELLSSSEDLLHAGVSSKELDLIFSSIADNSASTFSDSALSNAGSNAGFFKDLSFLFNDFEQIVREQCKEVEESFGLLEKSGALRCLLSGSGSSVVAFYGDEKSRQNAINFLNQKVPKGWYLAKARCLI